MTVTDPSSSSILRHPRFRQAVEWHARACTEANDRQRPVVSWLTKDLGRSALLARLIIRYMQAERVTASELLEMTRARNTSSAGRILQIVRRIEHAGLIRIAQGQGSWTTRPITIEPELIEAFRARAKIEISAAAIIEDDLAFAVTAIRGDAYFRRFFQTLGSFDGMTDELRGPPIPSIRFFLQHDAGMVMLCDLLLRQSPNRVRLLEKAPLVRSQLAKRFGVSRVHVNRMFREAEELGYLSVEDGRSVVFTQTMSDDAERHYALTFRVMHAAAMAAR